MARLVRKVSNKAVKGQKRERKGILFSKKFWIIIICAVVVLTAAGITIGVIVANNNKTTTVEVDDYFGQTQKATYDGKEYDVKFTKMTYQGVKIHTNVESDVFNDYTFVFAANLSAFYPFDLNDADGNNLKVDKHRDIFKELVNLQCAIDRYNEKETKEYKINLYIVDTSTKTGNTSSSIYSDYSFYSSSSEDSAFTGPLFFLYGVDGLEKTIPGDSKKVSFSDSYYDNNTMMSSITNSVVFVKNL